MTPAPSIPGLGMKVVSHCDRIRSYLHYYSYYIADSNELATRKREVWPYHHLCENPSNSEFIRQVSYTRSCSLSLRHCSTTSTSTSTSTHSTSSHACYRCTLASVSRWLPFFIGIRSIALFFVISFTRVCVYCSSIEHTVHIST